MADQQVSILIDALDNARSTISQVQKDLSGLGGAGATASKGMGAARAEMTAMQEAAGFLSDKLLEVGAAIAAAFTVDKLIELTKATMEAVHEAELLGKAMGMTADEMFRLEQVAEKSHVSQQDLSMSFRQLSRELVEAQDPQSKQAALFEQMGIATTNASGHLRQTKDVLFDLANAFRSYADTPEKAALATDLFSRAGMRMNAFLSQGAEGIKGQMGEVAGLTQENVEAAERWAAMQVKLHQIMTELGLALGTAVIPIIEKLITAFTGAGAATNSWKTILDGVGPVIRYLGATMTVFVGIIQQAVDQLATLFRVLGALTTIGTVGVGQGLKNALGELGGGNAAAYQQWQNTLSTAQKILQVEQQSTAEQQKHLDIGTKIAPLALDPQKLVKQDLAKIDAERAQAELEYQKQLLETKDLFNQGFIDKTQSVDRDTKSAAALADRLHAINTELAALAKANPKIAELQTKLAQGTSQENKARVEGNVPGADNWAAQFRVQMQQMRDEFDLTAKKVATTFKTVIGGAIDTISSQITNVIVQTGNWGEALRNIGKSIMTEVINAIIKMFVQWVIGRALAGAASIGWSAKEGAADVAAKTPGAVLSSISSFGVAAAIGLAAIVAVMAAFGGLGKAEGGMISGGTRGVDSVPAMLMPGEYVIPARVVQALGAGYFEEYRQGRIPDAKGHYGAPSPNRTGLFAAAGLVGGQSSTASSKPAQVNIGFMNSRQDFREWAATEGYKIFVDQAAKRSNQLHS